MDQSHVSNDLRNYANQVADIREGLPSGAGLRDSALTLAGQMLNNDFQYKMWQENNAYNTPAAQMRRLLEAGLNPNLAYQAVSTGNSGSPAGGGYDLGATVKARQGAVNSQTQRAQMILGAFDTAAGALQRFFDIAGQYQQYQTRQLQLDVDQRIASLGGMFLQDGQLNTITKSGVLSPEQTMFFSRFAPQFIPLSLKQLDSASLSKYQDSMIRVNNFRVNELLPWDKKLKAQVFDAKEFQNQMLKYNNDMLNTLPPTLRSIYSAFVLPLLNLVSRKF